MRLALAALLTFLVYPAIAANPADAIRRVLTDQEVAWNRGDIDAFMSGYFDSPETVFIGKTLVKGHAAVLANYHKRYPSREAMGELHFSDLDIRVLDGKHAFATGRFHLKRTEAGGGEASGIFSLLFEREPAGWKIILDHTS